MEEEMVELVKKIMEVAPQVWAAARMSVIASLVPDLAWLLVLTLFLYVAYKGVCLKPWEGAEPSDMQNAHGISAVVAVFILALLLTLTGNMAYKLLSLDWQTILTLRKLLP